MECFLFLNWTYKLENYNLSLLFLILAIFKINPNNKIINIITTIFWSSGLLSKAYSITTLKKVKENTDLIKLITGAKRLKETKATSKEKINIIISSISNVNLRLVSMCATNQYLKTWIPVLIKSNFLYILTKVSK